MEPAPGKHEDPKGDAEDHAQQDAGCVFRHRSLLMRRKARQGSSATWLGTRCQRERRDRASVTVDWPESIGPRGGAADTHVDRAMATLKLEQVELIEISVAPDVDDPDHEPSDKTFQVQSFPSCLVCLSARFPCCRQVHFIVWNSIRKKFAMSGKEYR